ncbi:unnamed protein product, partial [marine sediment metagenome]
LDFPFVQAQNITNMAVRGNFNSFVPAIFKFILPD